MSTAPSVLVRYKEIWSPLEMIQTTLGTFLMRVLVYKYFNKKIIFV